MNFTKGQSGLVFLLLCAQLLPPEPASAAPRLPSANRECALCHIMWLTEFRRQDVNPLIPYDPRPVVETGRQDNVSTERMCFSCHDGFVLDSRFLWKDKKHAHPVGKKPSAAVTIPVIGGENLFPLNDDGKLYCGTCHTAHGVAWDSTDSPVFMRNPSRDGKFCQACHADKALGAAAGYHPVNKPLDTRPALLDSSRAKLSTDGRIICQSCHAPHAAPAEKMLVVRNESSQLCGGCHSNHAAQGLADAARLHTHPVNLVPRQAKVPTELRQQGAQLGPGGTVVCASCHKPHKAATNTRLLVTDNRDSSLCVSCHTSQKRVAGGKHDMRLVRADNTNVRKQTAAEGGACSACHLPHQGKGPKMWAREPGSSRDAMAALCLSCHDKDGLAEKHQVGRYSHPVGVEIGRRVELPTYSQNGLKSVDAGTGLVTCASCHDPHQWDPAHPGKNAKPGAKGGPGNSFLRKINGPDSALCRTCHKEKWAVRGSEHDMARMAPGARNARGQTVAQSGLCGSCHQAHNGSGPRMWARANPTRVSPTAAACLSCHNPGGVAAKKLVGEHSHPLDTPIAALGIRATPEKWTSKLVAPAGAEPLLPLPLYDRRGRRAAQGGRVGCGSCHDPHRWSPDTAADAFDIEGDAGNSFLRISEHGNSELCVNCHVGEAVVSLSRHGQKRLAPDHEPPLGGAPGVCNNCHQPHNSKGAFLWARDEGPGRSIGEKRCTSCHRDDGHAKDKQTGRNSHPLRIRVAGTNLPERLPLYTPEGSRARRGGSVDCGSCHDPHQWQPDDRLTRSGQDPDREGDAGDSFLRLPATRGELCGECHREQRQVRATEHDLAVTAPRATNDHAQTVQASGLCGPCHSIHNATSSLHLWGRTLGDGDNLVEQACRGCHADNAIAQAKVPPKMRHPDNVSVWSEKLREGLHAARVTALPVFDSEGRAALTGVISCASCHDPHRWQANLTGPAPGKNTEGDVTTSFLRLSNTASFLCADCHGLDSIFRYKYFHAEKAHQKHPLFR